MLDSTDEFKWLYAICTPNELAYCQMLIPTLLQIARVLKPTGAYYHHCDWRTTPYLRLILNHVFGKNKFRNEIAWHYQVSMPYDTIKHIWKNTYETILFYAGHEHTLNQQHHPLTYQQIKEQYPHIDSKGKKYRWKTGLYKQRIYAEEDQGTRIGTCWTDIPIASAKERTATPHRSRSHCSNGSSKPQATRTTSCLTLIAEAAPPVSQPISLTADTSGSTKTKRRSTSLK